MKSRVALLHFKVMYILSIMHGYISAKKYAELHGGGGDNKKKDKGGKGQQPTPKKKEEKPKVCVFLDFPKILQLHK